MTVAKLLLCLGWVLLAGTARADQQLSQELRSARLGATLADQPELVEHSRQDDKTYYTRKGEILTYHGLPLDRVLYRMSGGRLEAVELWTAKVGPSHEFACSDLAPTEEAFLENLKRNFSYDFSVDTLLGGFDVQVEDLWNWCRQFGAYSCRDAYHLREPPPGDPDARALIAKLTTILWVRERTWDDLSDKEKQQVQEMRAGGPHVAIPLDVYHCQFRMEVTEGRTRGDIDSGQEMIEDLLGPD